MNSMISTIALEYNKKYFDIASLYTLNLYNIDNEFYIDEDECHKIMSWIEDNTGFYPDNSIYNNFFKIEYSLFMLKKEDSKQQIPMDYFLFYTIAKIYHVFNRRVEDCCNIIYNLNEFKKTESTKYKQIISENGEIIYIVRINNFDILNGYEVNDGYINKGHIDIKYQFHLKFNLNEIFNIKIKNPLDLKKLINNNNNKKINSNPYI